MQNTLTGSQDILLLKDDTSVNPALNLLQRLFTRNGSPCLIFNVLDNTVLFQSKKVMPPFQGSQR